MKLPHFMSRRHTIFSVFSDSKIFFINFGILILFFVFLLPFLGRAVSIYHKDAVWRGSVRVEKGIVNDEKYVGTQTAEIARIPDISTFIQSGNVLNLLSVLQDEAKNRKLSGVIVTGDDGVVIARTVMVAERGDYFFDTSPVGRKLANKEETTSIERLMTWPLGIESGRLVKRGEEMVGAVIGTLFLDDAYAKSLKEKYLSEDAEIVFYSNEKGITGTTFDPSLKQILDANLNTGTQWISWIDKGYTFKIGDIDYTAKDFSLKGVEGEIGKAVIFCPLHHTLISSVAGLSAVVLFVIFFVCLRFIRKKDLCKSFFFILFLCSVLVFGVVFSSTVVLLNQNIAMILKTPYTIYNTVLELEPSSGLFDMESEHRIAIRAITGGEAINAVNIELSYDPAKIEINDIITVNSFCDPDLFIEKGVDKQNGKVKIACGVKFPGFLGGAGVVAELGIQPLGESETGLHFGEGTRVLASDGLGTDVLRQTIGGSYQFVESKKALGNTSITVYSPTHPNAERWYGKNTVRFAWRGTEGARYAYSLDKESSSNYLSLNSATKSNETVFSNMADGIYYFHIAEIVNANGKLGAATTKKVMIDTTPPDAPKIAASEPNIAAGQVERVEFSSKDALSGLQKNFYVKFNGGMFLPLASPLIIAYPKGRHTIIVRAFDNAGNYADGSMQINAY